MSKFKVSKKDLMRKAVGGNPSAKHQETDDDQDGDGEKMDMDLCNEGSAKWRQKVLKRLQRENEQNHEPDDNDKDECISECEHMRPPVLRRRRIDLLAMPKIRLSANELQEPFRVRPSALVHIASERIQDLAMPKREHAPPLAKQTDSPSASDASNENKAPYQISDRLKSLAQPRRNVYEDHMIKAVNGGDPSAPYARFTTAARRTKETNTNRMLRLLELTKIPRHKLVKEPELLPGAVAYSALMCRASPRVEELAGPKVRWTPKQNEYAFKTRPAALRYNPSTRIEHLAIAKVRRAVVDS